MIFLTKTQKQRKFLSLVDKLPYPTAKASVINRWAEGQLPKKNSGSGRVKACQKLLTNESKEYLGSLLENHPDDISPNYKKDLILLAGRPDLIIDNPDSDISDLLYADVCVVSQEDRESLFLAYLEPGRDSHYDPKECEDLAKELVDSGRISSERAFSLAEENSYFGLAIKLLEDDSPKAAELRAKLSVLQEQKILASFTEEEPVYIDDTLLEEGINSLADVDLEKLAGEFSGVSIHEDDGFSIYFTTKDSEDYIESMKELIDSAKEAGDASRVEELYTNLVSTLIKEKDFGNAGKFAEESGDKRTALECFEKDKHFYRAGRLCSELGMYERALENFTKGKHNKQCGETYAAMGKIEEAIATYIEAWDLSEVVALCEKSDQPDLAKRVIAEESMETFASEKKLHPVYVGRLANSAFEVGVYGASRILFEISGDIESAKKSAEMANDPQKVKLYKGLLKFLPGK